MCPLDSQHTPVAWFGYPDRRPFSGNTGSPHISTKVDNSRDVSDHVTRSETRPLKVGITRDGLWNPTPCPRVLRFQSLRTRPVRPSLIFTVLFFYPASSEI